MTAADKNTLSMWQERFERARNAYGPEIEKMTIRENYYNGSRDIYDSKGQKARKKAAYIRNIVFEMIEAQVESTFPLPKITPYAEKDEELAKTIEDMLSNEMDRLPSERLNDVDERNTTIQGGDFFLVEWDSAKHTHSTQGELTIQVLHPRKVIPQEGVETLQQSDYVFLELAQTKEYIKRRYGVSVTDENEDDPKIRGQESTHSDNMVTQVIVYYRNDDGGIGLYSWVNDIVVEDLDDYQARVRKTCRKCGAFTSGNSTECPDCGSTSLVDSTEDYYTIDEDIVIYDEDGNEKKRIPAMTPVLDEIGNPVMDMVTDDFGEAVLDINGYDELGVAIMQPRMQPRMEPTRIPYYKPDVMPLIPRKNVSVDGRWLGTSDVDPIKDQQNEINMYTAKISEKTKKGGSLVTLPTELQIENTDEEMKLVKVQNPVDLQKISVHNMQADFSGDISMAENNYQWARQTIGITDSFQGRVDNTATSGVAKQISANQAAGRFESKKVMKRAAYAEMYEVMFKFILAYADEVREFRAVDKLGNDVYRKFNKYEFLEQDAAGEWYWNDRFLFSADSTGSMQQNRQAMWEECRNNLQMGAFGNPQDIRTLLTYWTTMEGLHYPLASVIKKNLEEIQQQDQQAMQQQQMMQEQMMQQQQMAQQIPPGSPLM